MKEVNPFTIAAVFASYIAAAIFVLAYLGGVTGLFGFVIFFGLAATASMEVMDISANLKLSASQHKLVLLFCAYVLCAIVTTGIEMSLNAALIIAGALLLFYFYDRLVGKGEEIYLTAAPVFTLGVAWGTWAALGTPILWPTIVMTILGFWVILTLLAKSFAYRSMYWLWHLVTAFLFCSYLVAVA